MQELLEHLSIATPLIWVVTDEPDRATDIVASNARRTLYRIDPFKGLVSYNKENDEWLRVVVEVDGEETVTYDLEVALHHVFQQRGAMVLYNFHRDAENQVGLLSSIFSKYRGAVFANNEEETPAQIIMLSCDGTIPPELVRHVVRINLPLPDAQELASIVTFLAGEAPEDQNILPDNPDLTPIVRAGVGLTEAEFIQAVLTCVREKGVVDAEFVNTFKRNKIKDNGILEIRRPRIGLDDIGGLDLAKELILGVKWIWDNPIEADKLGLKPLRRMLLVGVPGTGKSAICEATAKTLELDLAITGLSKAMSKWIGQSESNMRAAFTQLGQLAPVVGWIDELGRDAQTGQFVGDSGTTGRTQGEFLSGMQDLPEGVLMMCAANNIDGLPPEMLRAGRFDQIMFVGFPTVEERRRIFEIHLGNLSDNFNLDILAEASKFFTGAEIQAAINECKTKTRFRHHRTFNTQDLLDFMPTMKNRIWLKHKEEVQAMYRRALEEWDWASSLQKKEAEDLLAGRQAAVESSSSTQNIQIKSFTTQ